MLHRFLHLLEQLPELLIPRAGLHGVLHDRNGVFKPALSKEQVDVTKNRFRARWTNLRGDAKSLFSLSDIAAAEQKSRLLRSQLGVGRSGEERIGSFRVGEQLLTCRTPVGDGPCSA